MTTSSSRGAVEEGGDEREKEKYSRALARSAWQAGVSFRQTRRIELKLTSTLFMHASRLRKKPLRADEQQQRQDTHGECQSGVEALPQSARGCSSVFWQFVISSSASNLARSFPQRCVA